MPSASNSSYLKFPQDPSVARLVKLRNLLLTERVAQMGRESTGLLSRRLLVQDHKPAPFIQPARPTFEEMMAIVNRRHPR